MTFAWLVAYAGAVFAATAFVTRALVPLLARRGLIDRPGARSSHEQPTPRGGGLAPVGCALAGLGALAIWTDSANAAPILLGALGLAALSFRDDARSLGAATRLAAHALAAALALGTAVIWWPPILPSFEARWLLGPALLVGVVWFINLYNFMDGIDGLAGVETIAIGFGAAAIAAIWGGASPSLAATALVLGLTLGSAGAGFLTSNWHPARVFLGDVGSVPLGYLCACLLLALVALGQPAAALILPAYHVLDATATLLDRLRRGKRPAEAHREHAYQRAVQGGLSHAQASGRVAVLNLLLVALAVSSPLAPVAAVLAAYAGAAALFLHFRRAKA